MKSCNRASLRMFEAVSSIHATRMIFKVENCDMMRHPMEDRWVQRACLLPWPPPEVEGNSPRPTFWFTIAIGIFALSCQAVSLSCETVVETSNFLSPVRVISILKGRGERFVLQIVSQCFTIFYKCWLCNWPLVVALGCLQPISFAKICTCERCQCLIPPFWRSASISGWCARKIVRPIIQRHPSNGRSSPCRLIWSNLRCQTVLVNKILVAPRLQCVYGIDLTIRRCTTSNLCKCFFVSGSEAKPSIAVGKTVAWNNFNRNLRDTRLFNNISFWWNLCHAHCIRCMISTSVLQFKSPGNLRPRYLCVMSPCKIATRAPHISTYDASCKVEVVKTFVFVPFNWNPMRGFEH